VTLHSNQNTCEIIKELEVTELLFAGKLKIGSLHLQLQGCPGEECAWYTLLEYADVCCEYKGMEQYNSNATLINLNTV